MKQAYSALLLCILFVFCACEVEDPQNLNIEKISPINLEVRGRVINEQAEGIADVKVLIKKTNLNDFFEDPVEIDLDTTSDISGVFAFTLDDIDVESYRYELFLQSSNPNYKNAVPITLYSRKTEAQDLGNIVLENLTSWRVGEVSGVVKVGNRQADPLSNVLIEIYIDDQIITQTQTDKQGKFSFKEAPLRNFTLKIDPSQVDYSISYGEGDDQDEYKVSFIAKQQEIEIQSNDNKKDLGTFFLLPTVDDKTFRAVLSWIPSSEEDLELDYDIVLSISDSSCDINHLKSQVLPLIHPQYATDQSLGFAQDTCYWSHAREVSFQSQFAYNRHGGSCFQDVEEVLESSGFSEQNNYKINWITTEEDQWVGIEDDEEQKTVTIGRQDCIQAILDNDSLNGKAPEIITLYNEWPLHTLQPDTFTWYYEHLTKSNQTILHFPVGVMNLYVRSNNENDQFANVQLEIYQGNENVMNLMYPQVSYQSNQPTWHAAHVEYGFQTPNPSPPVSQDNEYDFSNYQVYYQVVPAHQNSQIQAELEILIDSDELDKTQLSHPINMPGLSDTNILLDVFPFTEYILGLNHINQLIKLDNSYFDWVLDSETPINTYELFVTHDQRLFYINESKLFGNFAGEDTVIDCQQYILDIVDLEQVLGGNGSSIPEHILVVNTESGLRLVNLSQQSCHPLFTSCSQRRECLASCIESNDPFDCQNQCFWTQSEINQEYLSCINSNFCENNLACVECEADTLNCIQDIPSSTSDNTAINLFYLHDHYDIDQQGLLISSQGHGIYLLPLEKSDSELFDTVSFTAWESFNGSNSDDLVQSTLSLLPPHTLLETKRTDDIQTSYDLWALSDFYIMKYNTVEDRWDYTTCVIYNFEDNEVETEECVLFNKAKSVLYFNHKFLVLDQDALWIADYDDLSSSFTHKTPVKYTDAFNFEKVFIFDGMLFAFDQLKSTIIYLQGKDL